jgi:hypothetical protein
MSKLGRLDRRVTPAILLPKRNVQPPHHQLDCCRHCIHALPPELKPQQY